MTLEKIEQPKSIKTKLFPYQRDALQWMISTEETIDDFKPKYTTLVPWKAPGCELLLNETATQFCLPEEIKDKTYEMSCKGAIYADEMGLGKSLTGRRVPHFVIFLFERVIVIFSNIFDQRKEEGL